MSLNTRCWGTACNEAVVCIHGLAQHGGVFDALAQRLVATGRFVVAVDLRGHGGSRLEPPWSQDANVEDLLETLEALDLERVTWVGHSFGGRIAAAAAVVVGSSVHTNGIALLEPGLQMSGEQALKSAETERLDWSFATIEGATQALLSSPQTVAAPRDVVMAYVRDDVRRGADGRFRFGYSPGAAVVAWSEMTLPPPPIATVPTLLVLSEHSLVQPGHPERYQAALGDLVKVVQVPNGHNVLWESPERTIGEVERFLTVSGKSLPRSADGA